MNSTKLQILSFQSSTTQKPRVDSRPENYSCHLVPLNHNTQMSVNRRKELFKKKITTHLSHFVFNFYEALWFLFSHSVQFSGSVMSDSLQPHKLQHARPPCPSPTPGVHPNPCPSSQWSHPTISSSIIPFSSCPQSFPARYVHTTKTHICYMYLL